jgi:2-polyprenyl-6-hydroxyphenyl methylase/3-demethylubiquinone-9 3-methyltransferase
VASLKTRTIRDSSQLVAFFNQLAVVDAEAHGDADRLLEYRLELILRCCEGRSGVLLEIGCGTAVHLAKLASTFSQLIGADISSGMVDAAWRRVHTSPYRDRIELRVDPAEELRTIDDASVDVVLCVGALEHMLDRDQAVRQVSRVLKSRGLFVLLTPNGRYCWYTLLAPLLGCSIRHLSTDRFLDRREAISLLQLAGLRLIGWDFWTFIPKGDIPRWTGVILEVLDRVGRICRLGACRGGLILTATRGV